MTIRLNARFVAVVILGLLAATGIFLVLRATPEGLTLSDDSIGYIAGARSMLAGHGYREAWLASNGPVTHFPPAFSSVLAFIGLFGLDPLRGARFVNASLFGLNVALLGILGWRMTKSLSAGLALAALFLLNDSLLRVHAMAMSEPLFIFLGLLSFWIFDLYVERDAHWLWLLLCGAFVGMAYLTRYAGLALVGTFVLALMILHDTWRKRLASAGVFMVGALPWITGWAIRNELVGGNATNRILVWHPITASNFDTAISSISTFLMPVGAWRPELIRNPALVVIATAIILGAVLIWTAIRARNQFSRHQLDLTPGLPTRFARGASRSPKGREEKKLGNVIPFTNGLYVFCYLAAIFASMSFFDASTKFKLRILAPIFVSLLILLVVFGIWLWQRRRELVIVGTALIFGMSAVGLQATTAELMKGGQGYASFQWYDSKAMAFLRTLPPDVHIYTNEPGAVYLYTGRGTYVLPDRYDPVTAEARPGFDQGVVQMQAEIKAGKAVLALFSGGNVSESDVSLLSQGLYLAHKSAGDEVFTAAP